MGPAGSKERGQVDFHLCLPVYTVLYDLQQTQMHDKLTLSCGAVSRVGMQQLTGFTINRALNVMVN